MKIVNQTEAIAIHKSIRNQNEIISTQQTKRTSLKTGGRANENETKMTRQTIMFCKTKQYLD